MKKIICLLFLLSLAWPITIHAASGDGQVSLIVKSSSESLHQTVLKIKSDKIVQELYQAEVLYSVDKIPHSNHYVLLEDRGTVRIYVLDEKNELYDVQAKYKLKVNKKVAKKLTDYFSGLESHHFGTLLTWEEVDEIIPRYTSFTITDLETGLQFEAQRRAGSSHADVQPLTTKDTKIMKTIYEGKWSWKRRAILVHHDGKTIAASMHGMPHGGGALANNFPGHFCIHYKDSTTHRSRSLDLSHQIMVYKAGGMLSPYVQQLPPNKIVELFLIALNQQDLDLLNLIYTDQNGEAEKLITNIESIRLVKKKNPPSINEPLLYELPLSFLVKEKGRGEVGSFYTFRVSRDSLTDVWKLESVPMGLVE
ncbi:hypothetical protein N0O92_12815 [Alkalihalobacillus sp. MEB130]|uniref:hypothetical protein n=1 Tax=Alkalihalobacillus sp. MEB130 TaxID=2976704 RepID=UPI0028E03098|nr:hypothetical protein [Alkalihalobacillus sp. MEB130]MDT8861117.1 hypothetical protein [Alkalihalobacillus sp. MEB130]